MHVLTQNLHFAICPNFNYRAIIIDEMEKGGSEMKGVPNSYFKESEDRFLFQLIKYIREHNLETGDRLPSIRAFAEEMNISQSQVRSGIMKAAALGMVEMRSRSGCYVCEIDLTTLVSTFSLLFESMYMHKDHPLFEIYELKTTLERGIMKRVAKIRTLEEVVELKQIIDSMEKAESQEEMIRIDEQFHNKLALISRNSLYYSLINVIQTMLRESRLNYTNYVSEYAQGITDHKVLLQAIKEQNEEMAGHLAETLSNRRKNLIIKNML